ncbi:MAG: formylglycine-generating enzyme family protein [Cyanobacteria bacterium J06641_5]
MVKIEISRQSLKVMHYVEIIGSTPLELISIPGGSFQMGAPKTETGSKDLERPQHPVEIQPFFLGRYPITQAQWQAVAQLKKVEIELEPAPSNFTGDQYPVEQVNWFEAKEFCARLSRLSDRDYRLPTDAEWEYACRAGTTTPFHFGETITTNLANYDGRETYDRGPKGEYRRTTTPVDRFGIANPFGLSDMHGNVWEWCEDDWHETYDGAPKDGNAWIDNESDRSNIRKVIRGGSWSNAPWYCRSAFRGRYNPDNRHFSLGFRVARSAPRT